MVRNYFNMTAIILAGGKANRMLGRDKAFLKVRNEFLIDRQLNLLKKIFGEIIVVTNSPAKFKNINGIKVISDAISHLGPLAGIYSGLLATKTKYNFVLACDMPFINLSLIKYMISLKCGFDAVVCRFKKGYETLFAVYSKNCIPPIAEVLNTTDFKIINFFKKIKLKEIGEEEIAKFGDANILFMNINTKKDLARAEGMIKKRNIF